MEPSLTELQDAMVAQLARSSAVSLAFATEYVGIQIAEARVAYQAAGALFGDDDVGLVRYLMNEPLERTV
jgi:hypothetical protein